MTEQDSGNRKSVLIAGSRDDIPELFVYECLNKINWGIINKVYTGGATGVDEFAELFIKENCSNIVVKTIEPNLEKYPPSVAPIKRNKKLVSTVDDVIIIWNGTSSGTNFVKDYAESQGKLWKIFLYNQHSLGDF